MTDQTLAGVASVAVGPLRLTRDPRDPRPEYLHVQPNDRRIYRCQLCGAKVSPKFSAPAQRGRGRLHVGRAKWGGECLGPLALLADEEMSESTRRLMQLARARQTRLAVVA